MVNQPVIEDLTVSVCRFERFRNIEEVSSFIKRNY